MLKEIWKDIIGYNNLYKVSSFGRIYSLINNIILKQTVASSGYLCVTLCKDKAQKTKSIHRLVAECFVDNSKNLPVVNHIDGNKLNNIYTNLEWVTYQENTEEAFKLNLMHSGKNHPMYGKHHTKETKEKMRKAKLGKIGKDNPKSTPIAKIDINSQLVIDTYDSQQQAAKECNISQGNINMVLKGQRNQAGGYAWKYIN